jgi:hypothetical protein
MKRSREAALALRCFRGGLARLVLLLLKLEFSLAFFLLALLLGLVLGHALLRFPLADFNRMRVLTARPSSIQVQSEIGYLRHSVSLIRIVEQEPSPIQSRGRTVCTIPESEVCRVSYFTHGVVCLGYFVAGYRCEIEGIHWEASVTAFGRMFNSRFVFGVSTSILFCLAFRGSANGQGIITGGITGTVVDQTGAVISGAIVIAKNESTGTTLSTTSNAEGVFLVTNVPLGSYTVDIKAVGFGPGQVEHVYVVAGNATPLGKQALRLGSEAQTV